jgi:hypothetical protein
MMGRFNDKDTSRQAAQAQIEVADSQRFHQQIILT